MRNLKTKTVAIVLSFSVGALLVTSCLPDPKTLVWGAVKCEPRKRDLTCVACLKRSCCGEFQACASAASCPCWMQGRWGMKSTEVVAAVCGPQNDAVKAVSACMDAHCAEDCPADNAHHALIGKPAPAIVAWPVLGEGLIAEGPKSLADARGKVVIVDFWATFCGPCKRTFPAYQELVDRHGGDVAVLAVSADEPHDVKLNELVDFAREMHVRFPIFWDTTRETQRSYRFQGALPTSFIVDRAGVVRFAHVGYMPTEIGAQVESLLAERAPNPLSGEAAPSSGRSSP